MNKRKCLGVLSSTVMGALIAFAVTTTAHAKVTSYVVNDGGKIISFNSDSLISDYTNNLLGDSSPMYDEYMKEVSNLAAFQDSAKGFVSYDSVKKAYEDATDFIAGDLASKGVLGSYSKYGVSGYKTSDVLNQLQNTEVIDSIHNAEIVTIDIAAPERC